MPKLNDSTWIKLPQELRPALIQKEHIENFAGIKVKVETNGDWSIATTESYETRRATRVEITQLARGIQFFEVGKRKLESLALITDSTPESKLIELSRRRQDQFRHRPEEIEPLWHKFPGETTISTNQKLPTILDEIQQAGNPNDSMWLIKFNVLIQRRFSLMRFIFAQKFTPEAITATEFKGFPALQSLMINTTSAFVMYINPIFILQSPWVWGQSAPRPDAAIMRLFETPEAGRSKIWTDLLDTFIPSWAAGDGEISIEAQTLSYQQRTEITKWWILKVAELLYVVSNPINFEDKNGYYDPQTHVSTTLTIERIFVSLTEIARLKTKDVLVRKRLIFEILDTLKGHGLGEYDQNLNYDKQYNLWQKVKAILPNEVNSAFSPVIESGFEGLREIGKEFWGAKNSPSSDEISIYNKDGSQETMKSKKAVPFLLTSVRNSMHGFRDLLSNRRNLSILGNHTGSIDDNFPDYAWWLLLRLVMNPEVFVSKLKKP